MKAETKPQTPRPPKHWQPETESDVWWVESGIYTNQGAETDYGSEVYDDVKKFAYGKKKEREELLSIYGLEMLKQLVSEYLIPPRKTHTK